MLPAGWVACEVADIAANEHGAITDGPFGSALKSSDYTSQGIRVIRLGNIGFKEFLASDDVYIDQHRLEELKRHEVKAGDLITAALGDPLGRTCAMPDGYGSAIVKADCFRLRPGKEVHHRLLIYWLNSPAVLQSFLDRSQGIGRVRINLSTFRSTFLPLPPLAEQRRIIAKLEALTARLARARAELERVGRLTKWLRQEALSALFRQHESAGVELLGNVCRVGTGSTPKRGESRYYGGGTIPWVTSSVVNDRFVTSETELITPIALQETNCKVFPSGSILVALYGEGKTRGKVAILGISAATNQALAVLHEFDSTRVIADWIRLFLEARYEQTREEAAGGVQPNLNLGIVKAIRLPIPPIEEQRQGVVQIEAAFARADRLEAEVARARALLDRLEAAILAKAFRGELVPQDPTDEPAFVLLDRIHAERSASPKAKRIRGRKAQDNVAALPD